jgi:peptidoglycan/xylan/chitin deacetylase (PgdA/CDA1 family)
MKHEPNNNTVTPLPEGNPRGIKVLMYHRIADDVDLCKTNWTCVHVDDFRKQLVFLRDAGFTAITFDQYRAYLRGAASLPKHPVIISFDDGYLDTYELAFPLLEEFGMKSVVFILGDRTIRTNYWDQYLGITETRLMNRDQILAMHSAGHEFGAHSTTHAKLPRVPHERAWEEISRSKTLIEMLLGKPVQSFCYPYGMLNVRIKDMVRHSGYDIACSVDTGPAAFGDDLLEIRRMTIFSSMGLLMFSMRMRAPFQYYDWTRWKTVYALNEIQGKNHLPEVKRPIRPHSFGTR